jgi:acyl-CoA thioesterase I
MRRICIIALVVAALAGCERDESVETATPAPARAPVAVAPPATAPATRTSARPRVVFLGDSITAGLGVDAEDAFPAVVRDALERDGLPIDIVNAGVSGDTTAGGLRRLDWQLWQKPDVVVVGLGGNDGLRGLDVRASEENLRQIVTKAREAGADVLLLGMLIPPNYGPEYTSQFRDVYPRLAKELDVPLVPFLLEGVGGEAGLNQGDGIHPNVEGHRRVAQNVVPPLRELVEGATKARRHEAAHEGRTAD